MAECHLETMSMCMGGMGEGNVHLRSLLWRHVWNHWVLEDAAVEELHDVEVGTNNLVILT